jgi:hypothetical protein
MNDKQLDRIVEKCGPWYRDDDQVGRIRAECSAKDYPAVIMDMVDTIHTLSTQLASVMAERDRLREEAKAPQWIPVSPETMPGELDKDCYGKVWVVAENGRVVMIPKESVGLRDKFWQRTNLVRPEKPQTLKEG